MFFGSAFDNEEIFVILGETRRMPQFGSCTVRDDSKWFHVCLTGVCLLGSLGRAALGGQPVFLGRDVPSEQRVPMDQMDHTAWAELLDRYVDDEGMVDYTGWKASGRDRAQLESYLQRLSMALLESDVERQVRLAFWVNAYNAVTIEGILREYPTTSIRNHTALFFGYNLWKDLKLRVGGEAFSLDQIEHEILRKMGEPRIHFAIVCASKGCPKLSREAYLAGELERQLTAAAQSFFQDSKKFTFDLESSRLAVSPILKWFAEDFGTNPREQLRSIATYVPSQARELVTGGRARVSYLGYDWSLNDQKSSQ